MKARGENIYTRIQFPAPLVYCFLVAKAAWRCLVSTREMCNPLYWCVFRWFQSVLCFPLCLVVASRVSVACKVIIETIKPESFVFRTQQNMYIHQWFPFWDWNSNTNDGCFDNITIDTVILVSYCKVLIFRGVESILNISSVVSPRLCFAEENNIFASSIYYYTTTSIIANYCHERDQLSYYKSHSLTSARIWTSDNEFVKVNINKTQPHTLLLESYPILLSYISLRFYMIPRF